MSDRRGPVYKVSKVTETTFQIESVCSYCEQAPARTTIRERPACGQCSESIYAFFRGERQVPTVSHKSRSD